MILKTAVLQLYRSDILVQESRPGTAVISAIAVVVVQAVLNVPKTSAFPNVKEKAINKLVRDLKVVDAVAKRTIKAFAITFPIANYQTTRSC